MDMLKRFITQIRNKSKTPSNVNKNDSTKDIRVKKPVNITTSTIQSNDDLVITVIKKPDELNNVEIDKNLAKDYVKDIGNTPNENEPETIINIENDNYFNKASDEDIINENLDLLETLLNNTSMSITVVNNTKMVDSEEKNVIEINKKLNNENNDVNNNFGNKATTIPVDLGFEDNSQINTNNYTPKLDQGLASYKNKCTLVKPITSTYPTNDITNEHTAEFLREFDSVLAEVQMKNDDAHSLDDIQYILKDLDDLTYNYQESKDNTDLNDFKDIYSDITVGELGTVITKLPNQNTNDKQDIEVISLSSNDSKTIDEDNTKDITNIKNNVNVKDKSIDNIDVISISSDDSQSRLEVLVINVECAITEYDDTIEFDTSKLTQKEDVEENDIIPVEKNDNFDKEMSENVNSQNLKTISNKSTECIIENESIDVNRDIVADKKCIVKENDNLDEEMNNSENVECKNVDFIKNTSSQCDTEDNCGYHSSDFEFITEEEAKMVGIITNFNPERLGNAKKPKNYTKKVSNNPCSPKTSARQQRYNNFYKRQIEFQDDRENYVVPEQNALLNMFRDTVPGMTSSEIHFLENKSVRVRAPMLIQYEGIGFDMNIAMRRGDNFENEEYREEAEESLKKIIEMYPNENTRRKRRRRF